MLKKLVPGFFFFLIAFSTAGLAYHYFSPVSSKEEVKNSQMVAPATFPPASSVASPIVTPLPTKEPVAARTKNLTVALLGDSMMQTMGEAIPLKNFLEEDLPEYSAKILNFGVGSTSIETAPGRVPQVISQNPDVVVIDSFGYNHAAISLDEQWQLLIKIVDAFKAQNIKVVLLADIAPNSHIYAKGIEGINWSEADRQQEAGRTRDFIVNIIRFAQGSKLPLADAYSESLGPDGEGKTMYIEQTSNLHPSAEGHRLVSQKIADTVAALFKKP